MTGVEIVITRKSDENGDHWRVTQERILPDDELEHDKNYGLIKALT